MQEDLKKLNELIIEKNKDNTKIKEKHTIIKKLLEDPECFFKMSIEDSYALLRELGIKEEDLILVYSSLIDSTNY